MNDHFKKGSIIAEQAYAQGKMLDHSSWPISPSGRTFSDIDAVYDHKGLLIFVEFARSNFPMTWDSISTGQRWMYQSALANKRGSIAILANHNVPSDQQIDTMKDVTHASAMSHDFKIETPLNNKQWVQVVTTWDLSPQAARDVITKIHAEKSGGDA